MKWKTTKPTKKAVDNKNIKNKIHPVKYREAVVSPKAKLFDRVKKE